MWPRSGSICFFSQPASPGRSNYFARRQDNRLFGKVSTSASPTTFTGWAAGLTSSGLAKVFVARMSE